MFRNNHTEVAADSRIFCNAFVFAVKSCTGNDFRHINDSNIYAIFNGVICCNRRMNLTEVADYLTIINNICLTSRM